MPTAEERFEELVRSSARLVRAAIARAAGRSAPRLVEDVEQQVYLSLWRRFTGPDGPPADIAPAYLYRAAVRETVRTLARWPPNDDEIDEEQAPASGAPLSDPERCAVSRELGARITIALARLTPDRRRAAAAHLQGFDVGEIERLFGWSYQRARNLVARGMAELRQELREEANDDRG
jgi:RNA polymerase sigma factor (sigma-70 family)